MLVERARVHEWTSNTILVMTKQRHPLKQWTNETQNTSGSSHQRQRGAVVERAPPVAGRSSTLVAVPPVFGHRRTCSRSMESTNGQAVLEDQQEARRLGDVGGGATGVELVRGSGGRNGNSSSTSSTAPRRVWIEEGEALSEEEAELLHRAPPKELLHCAPSAEFQVERRRRGRSGDPPRAEGSADGESWPRRAAAGAADGQEGWRQMRSLVSE